MSGACVLGEHRECSDSFDDQCLCSCPCHIQTTTKESRMDTDLPLSPVARSLIEHGGALDRAAWELATMGYDVAAGRAAAARDAVHEILDAERSYRWNHRTPGQVRLEHHDRDAVAETFRTLVGERILLDGEVTPEVTGVWWHPPRLGYAGEGQRPAFWQVLYADDTESRFAAFTVLDLTYAGYRAEEPAR